MLERDPPWSREFTDLSYEWRRLFGELFGTFLLVVVGAGASVLDARTAGGIGRTAEVITPGLMVLAVILFMGAVSGAHLNPVVSIAFALRNDFQWRRVPGYILAQIAGAAAACLLLRALFGTVGALGATLPGAGFTSTQAFVVETLLTLGLVSTILGTASSAQNIGPQSLCCRDSPDAGVGKYDLGHRIQRSKHRSTVGGRRGGIHRPRRSVGQPSQWRVDESRTLAWTRSGTGGLPRPLDIRRRTDARSSPGGGGGIRSPRPGRRAERLYGCPRNSWTIRGPARR